MSLLDKLKEDRLKYRKLGDRHAAQSLTTLIGELETEAKRGTIIDDAKVISSIKKTIEGLQQSQQLAIDAGSFGDPVTEMEIGFLQTYLPSQLTEEHIRSIITEMNPDNIGEVMKYLKSAYAGQYDGKMASRIAKEVLQ